MITYKEVDRNYFEQYDSIDMLVDVTSIYQIKKINRGLGGFLIEEETVKEYVKDLGQYGKAVEYEKRFDISNWCFFMAFHGERPIAAVTIASRTPEVNMLAGRDDLAVLWDIRIHSGYKHQGIGQKLFDFAVAWSKQQGLKQLKIECQNNNVPACNFYHKQGAILSEVNEYAYYLEEEIRDEVQFVWYLDL